MARREGDVPILGAAAAGWSFVLRRPMPVLVLGGLFAAANYLAQKHMLDTMLAIYDSGLDPTSPADALKVMGAQFSAMGPFYLTLLISMALLVPAFLRNALSAEAPAMLGVRGNLTDLKALGSWFVTLLLLVGIFIGLYLVTIVVVVAFVAAGVGVAAGSGAEPGAGLAVFIGLMIGLILLGLFLAFGYFRARFALPMAIAVAEERFEVFQSWSMTRGQGWRIMWAGVIAYLPLLAVTLLVMGAAYAPVFELFAGMDDFGDLERMIQDDPWIMERTMYQGMAQNPLYLIAASVSVPLMHAVFAGLSAYLYQGLKDS